jgi:transposase-like protein
MGRCVDRTPEEKWQIVQEGIESGNVAETCRHHGIAPNLFYRWKDEAEQGEKAALGGEALPPRRPRRITASGNWSGPSVASRWRSKS